MKQLIIERIVELHGSKANFCRKLGMDQSNLESKLNTLVNKRDYLNEFLNGLGLSMEVVDIQIGIKKVDA